MLRLFAFILAVTALPLAAKIPDAQELLQAYLRIDTTNPPGNEGKSAAFLQKIFKQHQIPVEVFDLGKGRANLMATLKGDGTKPAIILLHHMDVVPADPSFWKHPPLSGVLEKGELYGRGSVDIKGKGIMDLLVMLKLKESGVPLHRDIIYLAVADEEVNSSGSKWMIKHHQKLLSKAQYLIDEGSGVRADAKGRPTHFYVSLGEKAPLWLTLTFKGKTGHASVPHDDNAVNKVIEASQKILELSKQEPLRVVPGTEKYLELNVKNNYRKFPGFKKDFVSSLISQEFLQALAKKPELNALLRSTITITGLVGSEKVNTIPNQASLRLDCRLIPGTNKDQFIKKIKKAVGNKVELTIDEYYPAHFTSAKSPFLTSLQKVANGLPVVPTILVSSTDSSLYRAIGLEVFGFEAYPLTPELIETAHGNNERIPMSSLNQGVDILQKLLLELN